VVKHVLPEMQQFAEAEAGQGKESVWLLMRLHAEGRQHRNQ